MHTVIALVTMQPSWLRLSPGDRTAFNREHVTPVLTRHAPAVSARQVDVEAFTARCSDVLIFTTADLDAFRALWDDLRETPLFSEPHMVVDDLLVGVDADHVPR